MADRALHSPARTKPEGGRPKRDVQEQPSARPPSDPAPVPNNAAGGGSAATGVGGHVPIGMAALLVLITLVRPAAMRRTTLPAARSIALIRVVERPD
jgi:hypothetical protein